MQSMKVDTIRNFLTCKINSKLNEHWQNSVLSVNAFSSYFAVSKSEIITRMLFIRLAVENFNKSRLAGNQLKLLKVNSLFNANKKLVFFVC